MNGPPGSKGTKQLLTRIHQLCNPHICYRLFHLYLAVNRCLFSIMEAWDGQSCARSGLPVHSEVGQPIRNYSHSKHRHHPSQHALEAPRL